ncbi:MAG TPA: hypothetical protein VKT18_03645 [Acidimicrobiales bacterium]|nr:hypothetical protein [Acidimicrobiales bacterium]
MAFGISLIVTAAGAILRFAYAPTASHGFNWSTTGAILMIIGIIGAIVSLAAWVSQSYHHTRSTSVTQADGHTVRRDEVDRTQSPV